MATVQYYNTLLQKSIQPPVCGQRTDVTPNPFFFSFTHTHTHTHIHTHTPCPWTQSVYSPYTSYVNRFQLLICIFNFIIYLNPGADIWTLLYTSQKTIKQVFILLMSLDTHHFMTLPCKCSQWQYIYESCIYVINEFASNVLYPMTKPSKCANLICCSIMTTTVCSSPFIILQSIVVVQVLHVCK